jgi:hypothetical protein
MSTQVERVTLKSGERVTFLESDDHSTVVCLDRLLEHSAAGTPYDALLTLAARYKTLAIQLENMADARSGKVQHDRNSAAYP